MKAVEMTDQLSVEEAATSLGIKRLTLYKLIQKGLFTRRRNNPAAPRSPYRLYADEIERYLELKNSDLNHWRIRAAMRQHRIKRGRLSK